MSFTPTTTIPAPPGAPSNPAYGPTLGTNYYVPGRAAATPGGALSSGQTAYSNVVNRPNNNATDYAGLNQFMQRAAEYFDPFIQADILAHPKWWRDRIPKGAFEFFRGLTSETRIFRGGLPHQAGLSDFQLITDDPNDGVCHIDDYKTVAYGWERLEWYGFRRFWGSEPICLDTLIYTPQAQEQLAWIMQVGADYGSSIQEVWNRDMYVRESVVRGNSFMMTSSYDGTRSGSARYFYDPFLKAGDVVDVETKASLNAGRPFIVFPADVDLEPLNFDVLDLHHELLSTNTKNAAIGNAGGQKLFGLPTSFRDFERFVRGSSYHIANWREARPEKLIEGYDLGVTNFRGWAIQDDENQLRFKIGKFIAEYDEEDFAGLAPELKGLPVYVAYYTPPMIHSPDRVGIANSPIPEANPEYITAEVAVAPVFMNNVFENRFETKMPNTLGSGTSFGPRPGLNGDWSWLNYPSDSNPKGSIGRFVGEFRIHPKPRPAVFQAGSFLYRRCTAPLKVQCPIDNLLVSPNTGTEVSVMAATGLELAGKNAAAKATAAEAANASGFTSQVTLSDPLKGAGVGASIKVKIDGETLTGFVIDSSKSLVYSVVFPAAQLDTVPTTGFDEQAGIAFCDDSTKTDAVGKLCKFEVNSDKSGLDWTVLAVTPATDVAVLA